MKVETRIKKYEGVPKTMLVLFLICCSVQLVRAQSKVSAEIDTASIKIGEQIRYKITVETDTTDMVFFPEDQTFSPLEMVEALGIDTVKSEDRMVLQRL